MKSATLKGLFAVGVWGASFVATRVALAGVSPFGLVAVRMLMGFGLLAVMLRIRGERFWRGWVDFRSCLVLGITMAVHLLIQAYGLLYTSAINTGWIIAFIPVTIAVGAHALGQQRLRSKGWVGVVLGFGGVLTVTMVSSPPDLQQARFGDLLQIVSCLTWTSYTLMAVGVVSRQGALWVTMMAMGVAVVITATMAMGMGVVSGVLTIRVIVSMAFLGLVCSGLAQMYWLEAQHEIGPSRSGSLLYFEPFFTLGVAMLVLNERATIEVMVGGLLVLAGVRLVSRGLALSEVVTDRKVS
jgi:drug/metabolite transporter (DMT)-like permease